MVVAMLSTKIPCIWELRLCHCRQCHRRSVSGPCCTRFDRNTHNSCAVLSAGGWPRILVARCVIDEKTRLDIKPASKPAWAGKPHGMISRLGSSMFSNKQIQGELHLALNDKSLPDGFLFDPVTCDDRRRWIGEHVSELIHRFWSWKM